MFKVELVYLYKTKKGNMWSHGWIDWDGIDNLENMIKEYKKKEEKIIKDLDIDHKLVGVLLGDTIDIENGDYYCKKCECSFDELDDGECPFCGCDKVEKSD